MTPFVLSAAADEDLAAIDAHISTDSSDAAVRVLQAIREAMRQLAEHPRMGHARTDLTPRPVRFWAVYSCLIVYRPDTAPLQIVRVLHGSRDIAGLLG